MVSNKMSPVMAAYMVLNIPVVVAAVVVVADVVHHMHCHLAANSCLAANVADHQKS